MYKRNETTYLVGPHKFPGNHLLGADESGDGKKHCLTGGSLDHHPLAFWRQRCVLRSAIVLVRINVGLYDFNHIRYQIRQLFVQLNLLLIIFDMTLLLIRLVFDAVHVTIHNAHLIRQRTDGLADLVITHTAEHLIQNIILIPEATLGQLCFQFGGHPRSISISSSAGVDSRGAFAPLNASVAELERANAE